MCMLGLCVLSATFEGYESFKKAHTKKEKRKKSAVEVLKTSSNVPQNALDAIFNLRIMRHD